MAADEPAGWQRLSRHLQTRPLSKTSPPLKPKGIQFETSVCRLLRPGSQFWYANRSAGRLLRSDSIWHCSDVRNWKVPCAISASRLITRSVSQNRSSSDGTHPGPLSQPPPPASRRGADAAPRHSDHWGRPKTPRLQPRVDRLCLQRQDAEDGLVHAAQRLTVNEALQCLGAEHEFADGERALLAKPAIA